MKKYFKHAALYTALVIFSLSASAQFVIRVRPAAPVFKVRPIAPSPAHIWVSGDWVWQGGGYVWRDGYWATPGHGRRWKEGHWKSTRRGWVWVPGHWQR